MDQLPSKQELDMKANMNNPCYQHKIQQSKLIPPINSQKPILKEFTANTFQTKIWN